MRTNKTFASVVALLIGLTNLTLVIYVFIAPAEVRESAAAAYRYQAEHPLVYSLAWLSFTFMTMLSFFMIPYVWKRVKSVNDDAANTAAVFGIVGYAVLGVWAMTLTVSVYEIASNFVTGDEWTQKTILALGYQEIDPAGWFSFGAIGTWFILINVLAMQGKILGRLHSVFGILLGISHWFTVFGAILDSEPLNMAASVGGLIFYPAWFLWLSRKIYRGEF